MAGKIPATRFEFAVATARILVQAVFFSPNAPSGLHPNAPALLRQNPLLVNALMAMTEGFEPELGKYKNLSRAANLLEALHQQEYEDVRSGKIVQTAVQLQNPFADIPSSDASRLNADTIMRAELSLSIPEARQP